MRLAGIDAPERAQPYGQKAKQALSVLAFGQDARIDSAGPDQYKRTLGTVTVDTVTVNAARVAQGAAGGCIATTATIPGCWRWKRRRKRRGVGCGRR